MRLCHTDFGIFVNVDNGSMEGIKKSKQLGLMRSGLVDVIVSYNFRSTSYLFTEEFGGRAFALFRHPVDRVVSTFYYLGQATWEPHFSPEYSSMTIEEYARRGLSPTNWVTRNILGYLHDTDKALTDEDMSKAKQILKEKMVILLSDDFVPSMEHLANYLGWDVWKPDVRKCMLMDAERKFNHVNYEPLKRNSEAWNLIAKRNLYDIQLYDYAKQLYAEQQNIPLKNVEKRIEKTEQKRKLLRERQQK